MGVLVSRDGDYFHLDWCLIDQAWEPDPEFDAYLQQKNPFGPVRSKKVDGYFFVDE